MWFPPFGPIPPVTPSPDIQTTLYCLDCDCSGHALPGDACWFCGGATTHIKPEVWPSSFWEAQTTTQTVRGGNSFSMSELNEPEDKEGAA